MQPETSKLLESAPLDRSGFSAFVGDPINQPADRPRLQRVLNEHEVTWEDGEAA